MVLPGRETRWRERPIARLAPLVEAIAEGIGDALDVPFAFFGHSMGALVSFELTHYLWDHGAAMPAALFVSGFNAPHLIGRVETHTYDLPEAELLEVLRKYSGTPQDVLADREYMRLVLPAIRADFAVVQTYVYQRRPPIPSSIIVLGGRDDHSVPFERLRAWREHTTREISLHSFPGGHFFVNTARDRVIATVREQLERRAAGLIDALADSGQRASP